MTTPLTLNGHSYLVGTAAERSTYAANNVLQPLVRWVESDTGNEYLWDGDSWMQVAQSGAAVTQDASLSFRKNDTGTFTYLGDAAPGSSTAAAVWRISRMTNSDNTILYADGNANFDNVWDNRASLSYS